LLQSPQFSLTMLFRLLVHRCAAPLIVILAFSACCAAASSEPSSIVESLLEELQAGPDWRDRQRVLAVGPASLIDDGGQRGAVVFRGMRDVRHWGSPKFRLAPLRKSI